jgi:hypothetical protein
MKLKHVEQIDDLNEYALQALIEDWREAQRRAGDSKLSPEHREFYRRKAEEFHAEMVKLGHKHGPPTIDGALDSPKSAFFHCGMPTKAGFIPSRGPNAYPLVGRFSDGSLAPGASVVSV